MELEMTLLLRGKCSDESIIRTFKGMMKAKKEEMEMGSADQVCANIYAGLKLGLGHNVNWQEGVLAYLMKKSIEYELPKIFNFQTSVMISWYLVLMYQENWYH